MLVSSKIFTVIWSSTESSNAILSMNASNNFSFSVGTCFIHDSYLCEVFKDSEPFPTRRIESEGNNFVGANGHGPLLEICPYECRTAEHKDWIYC